MAAVRHCLSVKGLETRTEVRPNRLYKTQVWESTIRPVPEDVNHSRGAYNLAMVKLRFDDKLDNGFNRFRIEGFFLNGRGGVRACQLHECEDELGAVFPELRPLFKWNGCTSLGPINYPQNALYLAGDRDHRGLAKGEVEIEQYRVKFGDAGALSIPVDLSFYNFLQKRLGTGDLQVEEIPYPNPNDPLKPGYSFVGMDSKWGSTPFNYRWEAEEFAEAWNTCPYKITFSCHPIKLSEGKQRDFDRARQVALWPEATDEELSLPRADLEFVLKARLPGLLLNFTEAMIDAGFDWEPQEGDPVSVIHKAVI